MIYIKLGKFGKQPEEVKNRNYKCLKFPQTAAEVDTFQDNRIKFMSDKSLFRAN